jgi:hypothetical protein
MSFGHHFMGEGIALGTRDRDQLVCPDGRQKVMGDIRQFRPVRMVGTEFDEALLPGEFFKYLPC